MYVYVYMYMYTYKNMYKLSIEEWREKGLLGGMRDGLPWCDVRKQGSSKNEENFQTGRRHGSENEVGVHKK